MALGKNGRRTRFLWLMLIVLVWPFWAEAQEVIEKKPLKRIPVTVTSPKSRDLEIKLESVGVIKSRTEPIISAEIEGRVQSIHVDIGSRVKKGDLLAVLDASRIRKNRDALRAEVKTLRAQILNEHKTVTRYRALKEKELIATHDLDEAETKLIVLKMRWERARALLALSEDNLQRSNIRAPVDGVIDGRMVSVGDFLKVDEPLFQISTSKQLRAIAPFPETAVEQLQVGQKMYIRYPLSNLHLVEAPITEIRPMIHAGTKSVQVIVDFTNPGIFKPGASFIAEVVLERHENAVVVPNRSVVLRPAGEVVYAIRDETAHQVIVKTGQKLGDEIEIVEGLGRDGIIALDGAGFLTDGAPVVIKEESR